MLSCPLFCERFLSLARRASGRSAIAFGLSSNGRQSRVWLNIDKLRFWCLVSKQVGAVLTILGGVFYIIGSFLGAALGSLFAGLTGAYSSYQNGGVYYNNVGAEFLFILGLGIFAGAMIIVGGALLNSDSSARRKSGGILAIVMMVFGALPSLGGLVIGFLLTLIGSVIGLTYKEGSPDIVVGYQPVAAPSGYQPAPVSRTGGLKFCIKCGSSLHEGAVFCGSCGAPVPQS